MKNWALRNDVHEPVERAVRRTVDWAVYEAVCRDVTDAVWWPVNQALDWAVVGAVFWATVEEPDPVLGDFLLDLKPESDRAPRQMEAVSRGLGGRRTPNSEESSPTRW